MSIRAVCFDLYGTLINIETNEDMEEIYRGISHYLTYHRVFMNRREVRERYFAVMKERKRQSTERYPEIDVEAIWHTILIQENSKPLNGREKLAKELARLHRGISRTRLERYEGVKRTLKSLQEQYQLALISDAQRCFALPEIRALNIKKYFDIRIISGDYGYRKPDSRLFQMAAEQLEVAPHQAIYVGNDMFRDIYGAQQAGMKTIFVDSNQGAKSYNDIQPDYFAHDFYQVLDGVAFLAQKHADN
ncbi:HAD family hydrolase [Acidithiobacillus thiooxidans]|uniref:HAD family hydrolase n=1 Tax=Acidithiobacillus thiooxidans TaxID=930 RepID=UPI003567A6B8